MLGELINALKAHKKPHIDCHPIFARLLSGDFTRFHYLAYLRETYHLVKHTPNYLMIAADRVAKNDARLSAYFRKFGLEETGFAKIRKRSAGRLLMSLIRSPYPPVRRVIRRRSEGWFLAYDRKSWSITVATAVADFHRASRSPQNVEVFCFVRAKQGHVGVRCVSSVKN